MALGSVPRKRLRVSTPPAAAAPAAAALVAAAPRQPRKNTLQHAGLRNLGNTCYLNAVLQVLLRCPRLQELLRQSVPGCSERLVRHWVEAEFTQADTDGNGTLDFDEFCRLFNKLSEWSRRQLVATNQHVQLYKRVSEHYLEVDS